MENKIEAEERCENCYERHYDNIYKITYKITVKNGIIVCHECGFPITSDLEIIN